MSKLDLIMELEEKKRQNKLFQYNPYEWQKTFHNNKSTEKMLIAANQVGKALAHGTRVATPQGYVKIEDIKVGMSVIGADGLPTVVTAVYPQGVVDLYKITFDCGEEIICCGEHLWKYKHPKARYPYRQSHGNREDNPFFGQWSVGNTKEILNTVGISPISRMRPTVPYCEPWHMEGSDLPIDPYLLGCLLGDGSFRGGSLMMSSSDEFIIDKFRDAFGEGSIIQTKSRAYDFRIAGDAIGKIKSLGLWGKDSQTKFVPAIYLKNSPEDRLAVLRGLMDTDGSITEKSVVEFSTVSPDLKNAVEFLVSSLGGKYVTSSRITSYTYGGEKKQGKLSYRIRIRMKDCPFLLPRKAERFFINSRSFERIIHKIEPFRKGEATCISVDNEDKLFVIENGIVTHNTYSAAQEVAFHATGLYPDWWEGRRLYKPNLIWAASKTNEDCRDIGQTELLGGMENRECLGTGSIPKRCLGKPKTRQAGVGDVVDYVDVIWHDADGNETDHRVKLQFKSYEQGWQKFQGRKVDLVWLDEEPVDFKIYSECVMRTINTNGIVIVTFTPLSGWTELVERFHSGEHDNFVMSVGWEDAPHISEEKKQEYIRKFPAHELDARSKGIPMLGEGRVFTTPEDDILVDPFEIPDHWVRIIGIDFGYNDPAATVLLAKDRDTDTTYLVQSHKKQGMIVLEHAEQIRRLGGGLDTDKIPVSWPHDGLKSSSDKGEKLINNYKKHRLSLLGKSARIENDKGGSQGKWQSIEELIELMETGRFKVFKTNQEWLKEYRNYHQKNGKVVDHNDHLIDATRYALMMIRYAVSKKRSGIRRGSTRPILSSRL